LIVLPIRKRSERWKEYVGLKFKEGETTKKVTYKVTLTKRKEAFNKSKY